MKKIFLILLFCSTTIFAQKTYKKSLSGIKKVKIESDAKISVIAKATSELILTEKNNRHHDNSHDNKNKNRKDGLKPIYSNGTDNTDGFGFSVTIEGTTLIIRDLKSHFQRDAITITLPKTMNISIDSRTMGSISVDGFTSEVEADSNIGEVTLTDVTGPITAHSSTGTISVVFVNVSQSSPISISSSVGEIDVTLPTATKANLDLRTNGTVYTNFDFKAPPKKDLPNVSGQKTIKKPLNGGGVKIKLRSAMGNIYLRKG
jgi:hypothetical protein